MPAPDSTQRFICGNDSSFDSLYPTVFDLNAFAAFAIPWVFFALIVALYWRYKGRSDWWAGGVMSVLFSPLIALPIGMLLKPNVPE